MVLRVTQKTTVNIEQSCMIQKSHQHRTLILIRTWTQMIMGIRGTQKTTVNIEQSCMIQKTKLVILTRSKKYMFSQQVFLGSLRSNQLIIAHTTLEMFMSHQPQTFLKVGQNRHGGTTVGTTRAGTWTTPRRKYRHLVLSCIHTWCLHLELDDRLSVYL